MTTFIYEVLKTLKDKNATISNLTFILPSKRAGVFLKNTIPQVWKKTVFSPEILSIEEFTSNLSQLKAISNIELLFEFYATYKALTPDKELENFETFSKWAQVIVQDFNEIDRYLIPQKEILTYLGNIQDLNHWSVQENKTELVTNYLSFWNKLLDYYTKFSENLINNSIAYQGLIYREAVKNIDNYIQENKNKKLIFLGFNALNKAEETIIQKLLQNEIAEIYWDIENTYLKNPLNDAGLFARQYLKTWPYFKTNNFKWTQDNYTQTKNISLYGIPKNIGQAKQIGNILKNITNTTGSVSKTAIVLGDETLLLPTLNSLPESVDAVNITMGLPLNSVPLSSLFELLFNIHKTNSKTFYYKDVISLLTHQNINSLFENKETSKLNEITKTIQTNNLVNINLEQLKALASPFEEIIDILFTSWENNAKKGLNQAQKLIYTIKKQLDNNKSEHIFTLEYLYRFNEIFNELTTLQSKYPYFKNINTLFDVYKSLLSTETLDFKGEPLQGLQIMGMLESRVLDFETVIISSVNEGTLPSGKSNNSFIPFDVKLQYNLPTFKEKDAVYTYHFYRLLQRAKNIHILYNTEADALNGGEKSRFITQLELEGKHKIEHKIIVPKVDVPKREPLQVKKDIQVINRLKEIAKKGFSPSSLTNYMRNPIDFYNQKILKISEFNEVEEQVAFNTLGTVIHNTLEEFYKPLQGKMLSMEALNEMKTKIDARVLFHFKDIYKEGNISKGKNLIIFEIAKRYLVNFINSEIQNIKAGNEIKILAIETENRVEIKIDKLDFPVYLTGKVDRVDQYNGVTRIIDYKTGKVDSGKVTVINWEDLTTDYDKYSKSFQVLTYAYAMIKDNKAKLPLEAGIISFKNLNAGFIKFTKKESPYDKNKITLINEDIIEAFETELKKLIIEICNPEIDFIEKEV